MKTNKKNTRSVQYGSREYAENSRNLRHKLADEKDRAANELTTNREAWNYGDVGLIGRLRNEADQLRKGDPWDPYSGYDPDWGSGGW